MQTYTIEVDDVQRRALISALAALPDPDEEQRDLLSMLQALPAEEARLRENDAGMRPLHDFCC